jgi:hypothetical protein
MHTTRISRLALLIVLAAIAAAASIAPNASAATQRYASPTGTGPEPCASASACAIKQAVEAAKPGDEVIVAPGEYALTARVYTPPRDRGSRRRRSASSAAAVHGAAIPSMRVTDSTLRYVEVVQAPGEENVALEANQASLDQVIVRGSARRPTYWPAVISKNSVIRNSVIVSPADNGAAIFTHAAGANATATGTFRNVTAIATGNGGVAIRVRASSSGAFANVLARNVIARGGPGGDHLRAQTDNVATAKVTVDHSNWLDGDAWLANASIVEGAGNQTADPAFVDAGSGDYRQAAGSPTIDAGLDEAINGGFDVEGDSRQIGGIDIGADEFVVAPGASTGAATAVGDRSATLSGTVDGRGASTSYRFEYGPTTAYGSTTLAAAAGSGTGTVTARLDGLSPATTFHYRLVATSSGGTTKGADRTFTTASSPQPAPPQASLSSAPAPQPPTASPAPPAQPFAGVELVSRRLTYARRSITMRLRCPAGTVGRCSGRTKLTARRRTSARRVSVGRARFSIAAGKRASVRVRVPRAGRRLLGSTRRLRGRAVNAARDDAGRSKTTRAAVTIRQRHR